MVTDTSPSRFVYVTDTAVLLLSKLILLAMALVITTRLVRLFALLTKYCEEARCPFEWSIVDGWYYNNQQHQVCHVVLR